MEGLIQPNKLKERILLWVKEEMRAGELPERSENLSRPAHAFS